MKWTFLATATICCAAAFLLAIADGYTNKTKVLLLVVAGAVNFVLFIIRDWREERERENERALSRERAKIVGDFVHKAGGKRRG